jgi:hypothetical protein
MFTKLNCLVRLNKKTIAAYLMVLFVLKFPVLTEDLTNSKSKEDCIKECDKAFNETEAKLRQTQTDSHRDADEAKAVAKSDCGSELSKEKSKCTADHASETNKCSNQWRLARSLNDTSYQQAVSSAQFSVSYGVTQLHQYSVATNSAAYKWVAADLDAKAQHEKCIGDRGAELLRCKAYAESNYNSCLEKADSNARRAKYAADVAYRIGRYAAEETKEKCIQKCNSSS